MFKILVIDDDPQRENALRSLFNHNSFELSFIFEKSDFFANEGDFLKYDCIACDISLDNWIEGGDTTNMFRTVINLIGKEIPVVLFSSVINEIILWTNKLLEEKFSLIYTIALRDITQDRSSGIVLRSDVESSQIICNNIFTLLRTSNNYSALIKKPNEGFNILHISDLQFGDPSLNQDLCNSFIGSLRRSIGDGIVPKVDFVVVSGDVTFDGSPSQFKSAYIWISNLCTNLIGNQFQDRLLLVPGNHDINLSLCALNNYRYHFPKEASEEGEVNIEKRSIPSNDYGLYSIDPFRDFAFKITKDKNWMNNENISFFNDKFSYLGFRFLHLNTLVPEKQLGFRKAKFELKDAEIDHLKSKFRDPHKLSQLQTILLTHSSPKHLGYDMEEDHGHNWTSVANFLIDINSVLYIFGHRHKNLNNIEINLNTATKIKICGTGTLLCKPDEGDTRGFKIIEIKRKENKISKIVMTKFNYKNDATILKE
jgi:3',5'-cyclic AMP phosphodiesterase CpdA